MSSSVDIGFLARSLRNAGYTLTPSPSALEVESALRYALADAGVADAVYTVRGLEASGGLIVVEFEDNDALSRLGAYLMERAHAREVLTPLTTARAPTTTSPFMHWLRWGSGGGMSAPGWFWLACGAVVIGGVAYAVSRRKR